MEFFGTLFWVEIIEISLLAEHMKKGQQSEASNPIGFMHFG